MPLHPQAQAFVDAIIEQNAPGWHELPPAKSREIFQSFTGIFGKGPKLHAVEDVTVASHVPVRIYRPTDQRNQPVVLYFHGGGWVLGNLETHDTLCRRLASESGCVITAVDYRLAPEHKYPAALDDCYAAVTHVAERAAELDLDTRRLIVAGDSAGGNLAAAISLKARDESGPTILGQVLIYPVIEPDFDTGSYLAFATDHGLTRESMQWFWQQYVEGATADRQYVELANANLSGTPPAHVVTAEYDVLRDEGERFAERLAAAGVPTTSRRYEGMIHGFVHFSGVIDEGKTAISEVGAVIRELI